MQITILVIAGVLGAALGLRFKVLVLVPAIVIGVVVIAGIGITHGDGGWSVAWRIILIVVSLQVGYVGGTVLTRGKMRNRDLEPGEYGKRA